MGRSQEIDHLKGRATHIHWEKCQANMIPTYLRNIDPALLEGAGGGVVSAEVAVLAPMAAEGAVDTRQAPAKDKHSQRPREGSRERR